MIPPKAPTVAGKCWHNTETYNLAQVRIRQHQKHAMPLLDCHVGQGTLVLRLDVHCPESRGPCASCQSSTAAHDRIETWSRTASDLTVSRDIMQEVMIYRRNTYNCAYQVQCRNACRQPRSCEPTELSAVYRWLYNLFFSHSCGFFHGLVPECKVSTKVTEKEPDSGTVNAVAFHAGRQSESAQQNR